MIFIEIPDHLKTVRDHQDGVNILSFLESINVAINTSELSFNTFS